MTIAPATEIVVSLMSQHADEHGNRQLHDDPRAYIYKTTNITIPTEIDVAVVQNTKQVINLALPFYDAIENSILPIADDDIEDAVGGIANFINGLLTAADTAREAASQAQESAASAPTPEPAPTGGGLQIGWGLTFGRILGFRHLTE